MGTFLNSVTSSSLLLWSERLRTKQCSCFSGLLRGIASLACSRSPRDACVADDTTMGLHRNQEQNCKGWGKKIKKTCERKQPESNGYAFDDSSWKLGTMILPGNLGRRDAGWQAFVGLRTHVIISHVSHVFTDEFTHKATGRGLRRYYLCDMTSKYLREETKKRVRKLLLVRCKHTHS